MRNALRLMTLLILNDLQIVLGVLEWTVIKRATDYGQNVTLFCNVPNCCPKLSGWDRWTPVQRTLFIDVKTGRPNKKYDGKVLKDGYTLIIQNLSTQDLNVSYSCLYGVTLGERKFLQAEDALMYISATQPHGSSKLSEDDIIGLIIALLAAVAVVVFLVYFVRQKKERTEPFDFEAIQSDKDMKEDRRYVRVLVIGKDGVGKTSLVRRLLGKNIKDTESTDGIDIVKECQIQRDNGKWIVGKVEQEKDQLRRRILEVIHKKQEESTPLSDLQPTKRRKKEHNQDNKNVPLVSAKEFRTEIFDIPTVSKMHINESVVNHTTSSNNSDRNIAHTVDSRKKKEKRNIKDTNEKDTTKTEIIHKSPVIFSDFNEEKITEAIIEEMNEISKFTKKKINTTKGLVDCGIWDFAGQKDYYATHQTFFTPDAIYLLVADIDDGIEAIKHDKINEFDSYGEYIDFWLDSIHCFCTDDKAEQLLPPVILVCTGIDRIPSEQVEEKKTIYRNKFHEIFGKEKRGNHCRYIHFISNTRSSETEITNLKNDISTIANELDYFEENLPTSWIQTETILMVVKSLGKKVISLKNFTKIADQNYIKDEELLRFLQYQHKIGSIIFFEDKSDYIILQPQWLVECFRCLVCDDQKRGVSIPYDMNNLKSRGELSEHLIDELFKKELNLKFGKYKDHILGVMERFDIIVKPKSSNLNKNLYYMPCMITNASTLKTIRNNFTIANCTPWLVLEFTFLPIAYYNHILFKYISNYEVCKIKSEDGDELLTVYLGKTVVYLDKTKCTLLVVCFSRNAISLQLWELTDEVKIDKSIYTNILKDLKEKIEEVKRQFMHNLHYEIKAKCSTGDFSSRFGRINSNNFSDMCVNGRYRCEEHNCMHRTDKLENTWFKQVSAEDIETRRALLYSEVEELFKDHKGRKHLVLDKQLFVKATDKDDKEIESPKEAITELTFDHPCWGEKMPNAWVPLELEIAEMVAAGKQIMSLEELKELNSISKVSVLNLEQLHDFLHFQHSLGKLIYFDTLQLQDYVIINPLLMVEVMRPFVKDIGFWPKKRRMQIIFSRMSESGIMRREDLYQIWEQKDFSPILPYKEFIFNILIHLDILAEQRRYDTATGSRLPVENFFVPCMVTQRKTTSFMNTECTPERAVCLAFVFKGTVIPPALPNRLISACLSMWTLKQYEGRKLLFSGFIVVSFDKAHDVVICVEGNRILLYIVHTSSAGLIVPDVATGVKECLVKTIERISDFYQSTIHEKHIQQLPFQIEYSCSALKCFIGEEKALQTNVWVCNEHKLTHRLGDWVVWNQDKNNEQCDQNCQGLSYDALNQRPSDIELLRFSINFESSQMYKLVPYLEMSKEWDDITLNYPKDIKVAKFLVLLKWKEMKDKSNFKALAEALTKMDISTHVLCQVRRVRLAETDIPLEYLDCIPTDEILDALAPQIGQIFFQLGAELGLSIANLENIQSNNSQDLAAQNKEVLFKWREDRTVKPTIRVLVQALVNIGRGAYCLQEILKNVDLNTLRQSEEMKGKGSSQKTTNKCPIS